MGNDQSLDGIKSRRSIDASSFLRQVSSAQSTPRTSGGQRLSSCSEAAHFSPQLSRHRQSDCSEFRQFKARLSTGGEEMGNTQGRRQSKAVIQTENSGEYSLVDALKLTPYQIQLLQTTWNRVKANGTTFNQVFKLLCFKSPACRELFQKLSIVESFRSNHCCDLNSHAKVLSDLLDSLMLDLNQSSKVVQSRCMEYGASHVHMSDQCCGQLFDQLGECLTEQITKIECIRSKREAVKAWISLLSYLVDGMKGGYMSEWKKRQNGRLVNDNINPH